MRVETHDGVEHRILENGDGDQVHALLVHLLTDHLTERERGPVCVAMGFTDQKLVSRALCLLLCHEPLDCAGMAERLKMLPETIRRMAGEPS